MHDEVPRLLVRLMFEVVCYPVRDSHPIVVLTYVLALFAGIVLVGYAITRLIPQSPF